MSDINKEIAEAIQKAVRSDGRVAMAWTVVRWFEALGITDKNIGRAIGHVLAEIEARSGTDKTLLCGLCPTEIKICRDAGAFAFAVPIKRDGNASQDYISTPLCHDCCEQTNMAVVKKLNALLFKNPPDSITEIETEGQGRWPTMKN